MSETPQHTDTFTPSTEKDISEAITIVNNDFEINKAANIARGLVQNENVPEEIAPSYEFGPISQSDKRKRFLATVAIGASVIGGSIVLGFLSDAADTAPKQPEITYVDNGDGDYIKVIQGEK